MLANLDEFLIAISPCPFYPGGGGQETDSGFLTADSGDKLLIKKVFSPSDELVVIKATTDSKVSLKALIYY